MGSGLNRITLVKSCPIVATKSMDPSYKSFSSISSKILKGIDMETHQIPIRENQLVLPVGNVE